MKKDIMVPFDGSGNAVEALKQAILLAKATGEKIILLNVQPTFRTAHTKLFFDEKDIHEFQEQLCREDVGPALELLKEGGVPFEIRLGAGVPKEVIVKEASTVGGDGARLIVMGSRGMNPIVGGFLGSTSYGVLQEAPCPVMIVPRAEPEANGDSSGGIDRIPVL